MDTMLRTEPIQAKTKGELSRLRSAGLIPVNLQHRGEQTSHLQMELKPLLDLVRRHGESTVVTLDLGGKRESAVIQAVERDPITHKPLQVTFQRVVRGEPMKAHVPLTFTGVAEAAREGTAVLQVVLDHLEIRCLPSNLPEHISVDTSHLKFGEMIHVSDFHLPESIEVLNSKDSVVASLVSVARRSTEEEAATADVEEPAVEEQSVGKAA